MVSCAAGEPDAGAIEHTDGCVWADGDDQANECTGGASVRPFFPFLAPPPPPKNFIRQGHQIEHLPTNQLTSHRIHQKQVLATFSMILPFALVSQMAWWAVPIVVLVTFTLYGIDGIASQLEDPFGYDRNDIKMDSIVEDIREEIAVMVEEWKRVGDRGGEMFLGLGA